MLNWKYSILPVVLVLQGCMSPTPPRPDVTISKHHLEWPIPIEPCKFDFTFESTGDKVNVVIPYSSWVDKSICEERLFTYLERLTAVTCFYRQDLNEDRCKIYGFKTKETISG